ncbi:thioredoxin family protein [Allomuricauda sp. F6463D]|uniref:thioredoxin family protein n=1 Tax=Allomuricauda sp. F6463D TaxID=2926409 RepID=UPI001FF106A8|nr:thioredoxin family protein [Muricauda sp. F6463D]MCK0159343.1 thioredoxin family protein [Muricauda sp. F6463D]
MKHSIQILGTGCPKCQNLTNVVKEAVNQHQIDASIDKVEDIAEIMKFDVMLTPALVIDGNVVSKGRVPSITEIISWLQK